MLISLLPVAVAGYLLGSIPMGVLLARLFGWPDPRNHGSGHTGAVNVSRRAGKGALVMVLIADMIKGLAAVWLAAQLSPHPYAITVGGVTAVAGHCWSVWLLFRGGMGLASGVGAVLLYSPFTVVAAGVALLILRLFVIKHTPRATIAASVVIPPMLLLLREPPPVFWLGTAIAVLVALRHSTDWNRVYSPESSQIAAAR